MQHQMLGPIVLRADLQNERHKEQWVWRRFVRGHPIPRAAEGGCQIDDPVEKAAPWEIASRFPTASTTTSLTIVIPFWKMQLPASSRPRRRITSVLDPQFLGLREKGYGVYALMLKEF
jgi:hypothetical protein